MTSYFVNNLTLNEKSYFLCGTVHFTNEIILHIDLIFSVIHIQSMLMVSCKFANNFQRSIATAMILVKVTKLGTTRKTSQQIESEQIAIFVESMIRDKLWCHYFW